MFDGKMSCRRVLLRFGDHAARSVSATRRKVMPAKGQENA